MAKRNDVSITDVIHYLVETPWNSVDARILVVAAGTCNEKPFEAILNNDPGLHASADLYHDNVSPFTTSEYQSIRRKLKSAEPTEVIDHRGEPAPEGFESFQHFLYESMNEKHFGKKVFLNVPFEEKDQAKTLGAQWDSSKRQWFVLDKTVDIEEFNQWVPA
ncbi:MAG: hypothetical protein CMK89_07695 [Pseudomonadales bacterium]|nr:hypothetical protein [Pseudomonadales bacterium]